LLGANQCHLQGVPDQTASTRAKASGKTHRREATVAGQPTKRLKDETDNRQSLKEGSTAEGEK
jgi:hypothetical protein